ncbi:MAG: mechanosensitive ion channel [Gemmatimonadetes bacterium]|nr:mechanosensitive ion channel [Gemmatimonadota bacterium]
MIPLSDAAAGTVLGNSPERWLQAAAAAAAGVATLWVVRAFTERRLARLAEQTDTIADDFAVEVLRGIKTSLFVFVALVGIDAFIVFPSPADEAVRIVKILALVLQGFAWTNVIVTFWLGQWARNNPRQSDRTTLAALGFGVRVVLWSLLVLLALQNYGVNITTLITGLGVGGIAVALAIQNILGDLFAALSIVLDKPFVIGDTIVVDTVEGVVEKVGLKTTRLRSVNGEQVVFSNADLLRSRIRNLARREGRRYVLHTTVALNTDAVQLSAIPDIFRQAVEGQPYVALQRTHLIGTTPAGHEFETAFFVNHADWLLALDARQAILLRVYSVFQREGIALASGMATVTSVRGTA